MTAITSTCDPSTYQPAGTNPSLSPPPTADAQSDDWLVTRPKKGLRLRLPTIIVLSAAVALTGAGVGARLKERAAASSTAGRSAANPIGPGAGSRGGFTSGTITSVDGTTVHLTDTSGAAITITVPAGATINTNQTASASDLTVGSTITVSGTAADDGTTTARTITVNASGAQAG